MELRTAFFTNGSFEGEKAVLDSSCFYLYPLKENDICSWSFLSLRAVFGVYIFTRPLFAGE